MNTRIILLSTVIVIGMLSTACSTTAMNAQDSSLNTTQSKNTVSMEIDTSADSVIETQQVEETSALSDNADPAITGVKPFYGTWEVKSRIGTSAAYALSEDEMNGLIGIMVTYGSDVYKNGIAEIDISGYEEEKETSDQFYKNFGIHLTDIGITENTVDNVFVGAEGEFFGANFYIKDLNTLVIYYEGVFFEAIRT